MSNYYENIKVGDEVYIECYTSMGASSEGDRTVTNLEPKYDEDTGKPYNLICIGSSKYDGRDGSAVKGASMYFIAEQ